MVDEGGKGRDAEKKCKPPRGNSCFTKRDWVGKRIPFEREKRRPEGDTKGPTKALNMVKVPVMQGGNWE